LVAQHNKHNTPHKDYAIMRKLIKLWENMKQKYEHIRILDLKKSERDFIAVLKRYGFFVQEKQSVVIKKDNPSLQN
jgi:hypothetical protein